MFKTAFELLLTSCVRFKIWEIDKLNTFLSIICKSILDLN